MRKTIIFALSLLLFFVLLRLFVLEVHFINGNSMNPSILGGDVVVISKLAYGPRIPRDVLEIPILDVVMGLLLPRSSKRNIIGSRGVYKRINMGSVNRNDIIVFNCPIYQSNYLIKRCVAVPSDSVFIRGLDVVVNMCPLNDSIVQRVFIPQKSSFVSLEKNKSLFVAIRNYHDYVNAIGNFEIKNKLSEPFMLTQNYYYAIGDNRGSSTDSRTFGLIQEDHIVGKAALILISFNPSKPFYSGIRWDRIFKKPV